MAVACGGAEDAGAALAQEFADAGENGGQEDGDQDRLDELRAQEEWQKQLLEPESQEAEAETGNEGISARSSC